MPGFASRARGSRDWPQRKPGEAEIQAFIDSVVGRGPMTRPASEASGELWTMAEDPAMSPASPRPVVKIVRTTLPRPRLDRGLSDHTDNTDLPVFSGVGGPTQRTA